jgi:FlaA1/EpsC-like NDP-sugar epimerase
LKPPLFASRRRVLLLLLDVAIWTCAYAGAFLIRMDLTPYPAGWQHFEATLLTLLVAKAAVFTLSGSYRGLMMYATIPDLVAIIRRSTIASGVVLLAFSVLPAHQPFSRGVLAIDWMLTIGLMSASRVLRRMSREGLLGAGSAARDELKRVLIVGAGRAGVSLAKDLMSLRRRDVELIGFVDDDPDKQRSTLLGRPILGTTRDLPEIRRRRPVDQVIVAIPSAPPRVLRRISELARGIRDVRVIPSLETLLRGKATIVQSVPVSEDTFLSRNTVDLAAAELNRFYEKKRVLITGAGGSIGSELARQLAQRADGRVERLLLLDSAETPLWDVHRQAAVHLGPRAVPILASVRDTHRLRALLEQEKPDVILHAAALKHVPMCEQHPLEALATNSWASCRLAELACELRVPNFTFVSTDKAVAPSCVMGASKRFAETYVRSLAQVSSTRFAAVRFGNVLGSNGSVLPLFHQQITRGGPVTVTDPRATRFFMTIPEACGLILQATRIAQGGEVYVLEMGEPVRILDMAHNLIRLYGFEPGRDIEVKIIGLRPGEKLHETLVDEAEVAEPLARRNVEEALRVVRTLVPTYRAPLPVAGAQAS